MANTITAVLPSIYAALDVVSREMIGLTPAVQRNATLERAAVGQTVTVPVVPAATIGNITPGQIPPNDGDQTIGSRPVTIQYSKYSPVRWNGEEQLAISAQNGGEYNQILADQFAQSFRILANAIEVDGMTIAYKKASRAYGLAGTAPFATAGVFTDFAGVNQILDENGAPMFGRQLVLNSAARFNLEGKQSSLFKANEAGSDAFLRRRMIGNIMNFDIRYTQATITHTAGAGVGQDVNNGAGEAVGETTVTFDGMTVNTTGIKAGDIEVFAGDTNKYVVNTGSTATGGDIILNKPGLRMAAADAAEFVTGASYSPNLAFTPNALLLAARAPAAPIGGDSAEDFTIVQDPMSGLAFEIRLYKEYRQIRYEVGIAWGWNVVKEEHIAILLG